MRRDNSIMNREIKFRLWDFDGPNPAMHYLHPMVCDNGLWFPVDAGAHIDCPNAVPMQYTGLTDRNSKEIYEGDIIRLAEFEPAEDEENESTVHVVEWIGDGYPAFDAVPQVPSDSNGLSWAAAVGYIEVIGNIYENPELMPQEGPAQ